jgi:cytochrome c biogenesis protein CcdA/thiol-disulfide isomerase/thioredoxin
MAATFAAISTLAAVGGAWAVHVNDYGRLLALVLLGLSAFALLSRRFAAWVTRPVVALGARLSDQGNTRAGVLSSLVLGVATGFLWAPCAGPILGLILTGAALRGPSSATTVLLLAYALGAITSLALVAAASTRVIAALKRSFAAGEWLRRTLGAAVLLAVAAIALGWDRGVLTRLSVASTGSVEQTLIDRIAPRGSAGGTMAMQDTMKAAGAGASDSMLVAAAAGDPPVEGQLPELSGAVAWLNSAPLTRAQLRGKVALVDFWTYSCINCLRALPYVKSWYQRYRDQGLVVIGVHAPEFAFEKNVANVTRAVHDLGITYPVALDNDYVIWKAFENQYWPAHYFIDTEGRIRHHHFGEGEYAESERVIQQLLAEAGKTGVSAELVAVNTTGAEAAADMNNVGSPETYVGYERAENFISPGGVVEDIRHVYAAAEPRLNEWALAGVWTIGKEDAVLNDKGGSIVFRFHARDLHLVLGPGPDGKPVRFRVTIDGMAPGPSHGSDADTDGQGIVTGQRLYQLIRQSGNIADHTFEIRFLDPGVTAYAFTFG